MLVAEHWYTVFKHSDCGMDGKTLTTSRVTSVSLGGIVVSVRVLIRSVELCR